MVITRSWLLMCAAMIAAFCAVSSSVCARAYPPVPSAFAAGSTNCAPSERTCSPAAPRTSNAETTAPSRRAVAIACNPATPAPMMNAFAGAMDPAAVVSMGRNLSSAAAPISAALYPATPLCEERTSMDCARVMRGTSSSASAVILALASAGRISSFAPGVRRAMSVQPFGRAATSSALGFRTFATTSGAAAASAAASATRVTPAFSYAASRKPAALPAPRSTTT